MSGRTLVVSATNLLARGFLVVPTDRKGRDGEPVNALFAVARAIHRVLAFKRPSRAIAVLEQREPPPGDPSWPALLRQQLPSLGDLLTTLGLVVVEAAEEPHLVASY